MPCDGVVSNIGKTQRNNTTEYNVRFFSMTSTLEVDRGINSFFHDKKSMSAGNSSYVHLLAGGYVVDRICFRWSKRFIPQHAVGHYVECL